MMQLGFIFKTISSEQGGTMRTDLAAAEKQQLSLPAGEALRLAEWGLAIEALFGCPQDIEWCRNRDGALFVLQARPLQTREKAATTAAPPAPSSAAAPLITSRRLT